VKEKLESFILQIPELGDRKPADLIDYFVYYLNVIEEKGDVKPIDVMECFELTNLSAYSNVSSYLSRHSKRKKGGAVRFIKTKNGYQLERNYELELQKTLHTGPAKIETSYLLRKLLTKLTDKKKQLFLQEAIDCYEIGARRAAIVLVWILTIYHLYEYILKKELPVFNTVLSKNTDKRIKIKQINKIDDFSEIPEGKFIEFIRAAKIISNDVRKILDTKLGVRNTSAHPSSVVISEVKATDFISDLIINVILKYKI